MSQSNATPDARVDFNRLKSEILELSEIGRDEKDHGIYRMAFTPADMTARRWLMAQMEDAGFSVTMDGAGNVLGRWPRDLEAPAVLTGSHLDTVPCGGHLDGSLGVLTSLECVRAIKEAGLTPRYPLEVVAFSDEEGRFGGMFGSEAFCGEITPETLHRSQDLDGIRLSDAMREAGLDPMGALDARRSPETLKAFLELHIEQGPVLDAESAQVGVVEHITGLLRWSARLLGKANHAGTTPMEMRHDAFLGLAEFANEIPRVLEEIGSPDSRATIGNVALSPGSANTIPGRADFSLDLRDANPETLEALQSAFRKALSAMARRRGLAFEFDLVSHIQPVTCDSGLVGVLEAHAKELGVTSRRMLSGAAHDSQMLVKLTPVGMIFVPSQEGRSHSPAEWTHWSEIEAGANVALRSLMEICGATRRKP